MSAVTAAIISASALAGSAIIGAVSSNSAANTQARAADRAAQLQADQFAQQRADQEPFRQAGITTQNELLRQLGLGGEAGSAGYGNLMRNFSQQDFQADPGYGFRMSEGLKAIDRQAAARGGLISGSALKAAQGYGQDLASQEYQNAFNRYYNERNNMLAPLQSLAGIGQTSVNAMGTAGQNYGANAGNLAMIGGANQANAALQLGNIRASQYGNIGAGINQAMNTDWSKIGNTLGNWFGSSSSSYKPDYSGNPYAPIGE
jgi:hypothetical protein